jgi:hypothetical protein
MPKVYAWRVSMRNECKQIVAVGALVMSGLMAAGNAQAQGDSTIVVEKPN